MRKALFVICLSVVAALFAAGPAAAGTKYANIKTTATCNMTNGILDVTVGWVYTDLLNPGPAPLFSGERLILQKHYPNSNEWVNVTPDLYLQYFSPPVDSPVDFSGNLCLIKDAFAGANALRVEAQLTVSNSNPNRKDGQVFTGRCISFPPPSCP